MLQKFILGARCTDGVVLIGDTKFIIDRGIDLMIIKYFRTYIIKYIGFAGMCGTFELFQLNIMGIC
jgi:hypothetical protein